MWSNFPHQVITLPTHTLMSYPWSPSAAKAASRYVRKFEDMFEIFPFAENVGPHRLLLLELSLHDRAVYPVKF